MSEASELRTMFHNALASREAWESFETAVEKSATVAMKTWVTIHGEQIRRQTLRRGSIPSVHANGALDNSLDRVRAMMADRAFSCRNRARLNLLLELIRLGQLRADNAADYASATRAT
ncbi:MAG: hypothetical protein ABIN10_00895 [Specibacter sp.]